MKNRLAALVAALAVSLALAFAPNAMGDATVNIGQFSKVVWSDTLAKISTDSVSVTDSVNIAGARVVYLTVQSSGVDTMTIPIIQTKFANGQWDATGGAARAPFRVSAAPGFAATTAINQSGVICYQMEFVDNAGFIPLVAPEMWVRWRVKSVDVRRNNASGMVPSGRYTLRVSVAK